MTKSADFQELFYLTKYITDVEHINDSHRLCFQPCGNQQQLSVVSSSFRISETVFASLFLTQLLHFKHLRTLEGMFPTSFHRQNTWLCSRSDERYITKNVLLKIESAGLLQSPRQEQGILDIKRSCPQCYPQAVWFISRGDSNAKKQEDLRQFLIVGYYLIMTKVHFLPKHFKCSSGQ